MGWSSLEHRASTKTACHAVRECQIILRTGSGMLCCAGFPGLRVCVEPGDWAGASVCAGRGHDAGGAGGSCSRRFQVSGIRDRGRVLGSQELPSACRLHDSRVFYHAHFLRGRPSLVLAHRDAPNWPCLRLVFLEYRITACPGVSCAAGPSLGHHVTSMQARMLACQHAVLAQAAGPEGLDYRCGGQRAALNDSLDAW